MVRIAPFRAIRPHPSKVARVASVPYDVVSTDEARTLAEGNPHSFLHVIRPEIDLPAGTNPYDDAVYAGAADALRRLVDQGSLIDDGRHRMFLYRQVMNHRAQVGIVCCCHIDDYESNVIRKHEHTRPDKEDDRTRHVQTVGANTGPVFMTFRAEPSVRDLIRPDQNARPLYHFDAPDGVTHTVWPIDHCDAYVEAFMGIPALYVADGHHRSASAARAGAERRAANGAHTGDEEYNWFLSVLFPAPSLEILPYNRIIRDLGGHSTNDVLDALRQVGSVTPGAPATPERRGTFAFYLDGAWHGLEIDPDSIDMSDPVGSLDVALLQSRVLDPIFGITDVRTDPRVDFVGGVRGTVALEEAVDSGRAAVAISMYPTSIDDLMSVADAGEVMPPKSTWFEPKLRSGLFVHLLDDVSTWLPTATGATYSDAPHA